MCFFAISAAWFGAAAAAASGYPERPVRLLIGFSAGGSVDTIGRILAQKMSERWAQQVIVDNRPGGAGAIVMQIAEKAPRDGHTLMMGSSTQFTVGPAMQAGPSTYPPLASFTPIAKAVVGPIVLTVHPTLPVRTVRELLQYGKSRSGQISFGSAGAGTASYIAMLIMARAGGFEIISVPYKGGSDVVVAAVGGHVPVAIGTFSTALPHIKAGKLRALAVTESRRLSIAPDIPTVAESGLPGFEVSQWFGIFAPANIPAPITQKLGTELGAILALPDAKERLEGQGLEVSYAGPSEFGAYLRSELGRWTKLIKELGLQEKPR